MAPPLRNLKLLASPLKGSETPPIEPTAPPEFGRHTGDVLRGLGYSTPAIEELRGRHVV